MKPLLLALVLLALVPSLFLLGAPAPRSIGWTHDPVAAEDTDFTVTVNSSSSYPVVVKFYLNGELRQTTRITGPGNRATYHIPAGTAGSAFTAEVSNNTDMEIWTTTIF